MLKVKLLTISILTSMIMSLCPVLLADRHISQDNPDIQEQADEPPEKTDEPSKGSEEPASPTDAEPGTWQDSEAGRRYIVDGQVMKGWYKPNNVWYYFGADGIMQHDTNIGIYVLGADGVLMNPPAEGEPLPHGEIYNSNEIAYLNPDGESAAKVEEDIYTLYSSESRSVDDIKKARYSYNALSMAQKARVHNESLLAEMEIDAGITYNYEDIYSLSEQEASSDNGSKKGTNYVFEITSNNPVLTIVVRYPVDEEGAPRPTVVTLTSPDGTVNELTNDTTQLRTSSMNIFLTWTDTFVQLDVSHAEYGKWSINTDNVCSFIPKEYAGSKTEIEAIPEDDIKTTEEAATPEEHETGSQLDVGLIVGIILVILVIIFMIYIAKHPFNKTINSGKKQRAEEVKKQEKDQMISDEEEYRQMKAQLAAEYDNYYAGYSSSETDKPAEENTEPTTDQHDTDEDPFMTGGQDEVEVTNSIEEYDASFTEAQNDDWIDDAFD